MIFLKDFDLIVINSSGGKDSLCALYEVHRMAVAQGFPLEKVVVSHQDLGAVEWAGTKELVKEQADLFGLETFYSSRTTKSGEKESLLDYVKRRKRWPSSKQRFCTSDFKRDPGAKVVRSLSTLAGARRVLNVFGFRSEESPARAKREVLTLNKRLSTRTREVFDWLPIHDWSEVTVWSVIKEKSLPSHPAYSLGMPRLSCCFCIFSPFDALVIAGKANPELLDQYVEVEREIGHTFKTGSSIESVRDAVRSGYEPKDLSGWVM